MRSFMCKKIVAAILSTLAYWATSVAADQARVSGVPATIVVTGQKPVADEEVKQQVETALHTDPYFYDGHVTVTVINGVVHLQGVVFDNSDMQAARRISKKIAGAKRVVNELEICSCDGGGGS
jgi:osmotically-inducible protein OsmY